MSKTRQIDKVQCAKTLVLSLQMVRWIICEKIRLFTFAMFEYFFLQNFVASMSSRWSETKSEKIDSEKLLCWLSLLQMVAPVRLDWINWATGLGLARFVCENTCAEIWGKKVYLLLFSFAAVQWHAVWTWLQCRPLIVGLLWHQRARPALLIDIWLGSDEDQGGNCHVT